MRNGICLNNTQSRPYSPNNNVLGGGLIGSGVSTPPLTGGPTPPPILGGGLTPTGMGGLLNFTGYEEPASFKSDESLSNESTSLTDNTGSGLIAYAMGLIGVGVLVYVIGYSFNKGKKEA